MKWKGTCPSGKSWSPDQVRARNQGFEGSASFEDHEAGTLALGVGVVTDDAHVVIGVCAVASLELTDHNVRIVGYDAYTQSQGACFVVFEGR